MSKVLFIGDSWYGSNARSLAVGFREAGAEVLQIDTTPVSRPKRLGAAWMSKRLTGRRAPWTVEATHRSIEEAVTRFRPDLLFCFKTIHLDQERLLAINARVKVHYSADDISNAENLTEGYLRTEHAWDVILTTKKHNVRELAARGVREPQFVYSAYDPAWHHPAPQTRPAKYLVGFIGNRRPDRQDLVASLAGRYRDSMYVAGPGWKRYGPLARTGVAVSGPRYGEDLAAAIGNVRANLVLLNSANRDQHTCRSFEVPASGGLFVGERTVDHQELLDEGTEALFFATSEELDEHLDRAASDPVFAGAIADAGLRRIRGGKHTYRDRAMTILDLLDQR